VVHTTTCASFVGQSTTAASATWVAASSAAGTATNGDKSIDGRGGVISGWQGRSSELVVHVTSEVKDASHYLVRGEDVVGVERVDDTLFG
jgi:hypothetical protein